LGALDTLLQVQERDIALDRLQHRRQALPERQELARLDAALEALGRRRAEVGAVRQELSTRQEGLEAEVEAMVRRVGEIEGRLYGGQVSASRELSAMAGEVEHLQSLRSDREDQVLALMEEIEPLDADLASLDRERGRLEAERAEVLEAIRRAEEAIGAEEAEERRARRALAASIPADLMGQYERLRAKLGGVGAARLVNGSCTGCHLSLPASERERIRHLPPEEVVTCEQCGRILVR